VLRAGCKTLDRVSLEQSRSQYRNTGWVENGLRAALLRTTWGCRLLSMSSRLRRPTVSWAASRGGLELDDLEDPFQSKPFYDYTLL